MKINWGAIGLAAIVHFGFGAVWFSTFGAAWRAGTRLSPEELQTYMSHPNPWPYFVGFLCSLGMALVISCVIGVQCRYGLISGGIAGLMVGLACALAMITEMAFEMRTANFMMISGGYPLLGCILMGLVIGVWKPKGVEAQA